MSNNVSLRRPVDRPGPRTRRRQLAFTHFVARRLHRSASRLAYAPGWGQRPWDNAGHPSPAALRDTGPVSSPPYDRFFAFLPKTSEESNTAMIDDDHYWDPYPQTLTVAEMQTILRISRPTAFSRLQNGVIPAHYIAGSWIVFKAEVRSWLESTSNQATVDRTTEVDVLASYPEELTYQDLMVLFRKSKETIYRWLHSGEIPAFHVTGRWIIRKAHIREKLRETSNQKPTVVVSGE